MNITKERQLGAKLSELLRNSSFTSSSITKTNDTAKNNMQDIFATLLAKTEITARDSSIQKNNESKFSKQDSYNNRDYENIRLDHTRTNQRFQEDKPTEELRENKKNRKNEQKKSPKNFKNEDNDKFTNGEEIFLEQLKTNTATVDSVTNKNSISHKQNDEIENCLDKGENYQENTENLTEIRAIFAILQESNTELNDINTNEKIANIQQQTEAENTSQVIKNTFFTQTQNTNEESLENSENNLVNDLINNSNDDPDILQTESDTKNSTTQSIISFTDGKIEAKELSAKELKELAMQEKFATQYALHEKVREHLSEKQAPTHQPSTQHNVANLTNTENVSTTQEATTPQPTQITNSILTQMAGGTTGEVGVTADKNKNSQNFSESNSGINLNNQHFGLTKMLSEKAQGFENAMTSVLKNIPQSARESVVEKLNQMLQNVKQTRVAQTMVVRLNPLNLGEVTLKVTQRNDQIFTRVISNNSDVENYLKLHSSEILNSLANSGIKIENISLSFGFENNGQNNFSQEKMFAGYNFNHEDTRGEKTREEGDFAGFRSNSSRDKTEISSFSSNRFASGWIA